ncbi:MAG: hypothetical protein VB959_15310 [Rhodospirillales bacterium]
MTRTVLAALFVIGLNAPLMAGDLARTEPHPSLSPKAVVTIIMTALRHNDAPRTDRGIQVTFNFASPANKRATGPLSRFISMVKGQTYGPMIGHQSVVFENYEINGDRAPSMPCWYRPMAKALAFVSACRASAAIVLPAVG